MSVMSVKSTLLPSGSLANAQSWSQSVLVLFLLLALCLQDVPQVAHAQPPVAMPVDMELGTDSSVLPPAPALIHAIHQAVELTHQWHPPRSQAEWEARRPEVARALRESLGIAQWPAKCDLNVKSYGTIDRSGYRLERLTFESRPGFPVTALLYRPVTSNTSPRHPAVVCPIGHWLTPGKTATEVQSRCIQLARMGIVALSYDAIGQGERMVPGNRHHEAGYALLPLGETIAGWMIWDSMRAIDLLQGLPDVDPQRIGITGNSGGGLNSLLTAALDERIQVATVVGYTYSFQNWLAYGGTHCTCTHWPSIVSKMEWFEIAGLIAPRAALLLQGDRDGIFLISGARRAARDTATIFQAMDVPEQFRFIELPGQRHSYAAPFRAAMYEWMADKWQLHLDPARLQEQELDLLPELDRQLLCDPDRQFVKAAPTVVQLAQNRARELEAQRVATQNERTHEIRQWVDQLVKPPAEYPHFLAPQVVKQSASDVGTSERISIASEDGVRLTGKLFLPPAGQSATRTLVVCDARGLEHLEKHLDVTALQRAGWMVLAIDVRGRGQQRMRHRDNWNINFRLVSTHVLAGTPLPGRRAYDLRRAIDYLEWRDPQATQQLTLWGKHDDSLSSLLAAISDPRVDQVLLEGGFSSFRSQIISDRSYPIESMGDHWNDPQVTGTLSEAPSSAEVDLGSIIPGSLLVADIPELIPLLENKRLLCADLRDGHTPGESGSSARLLEAVRIQGGRYIDRPLSHVDLK